MEEDFSDDMTFMKLDLDLEIDPPETLTNESSSVVKKLYDDWKHSNKCCMMMIENCMDEAIYTSVATLEPDPTRPNWRVRTETPGTPV